MEIAVSFGALGGDSSIGYGIACVVRIQRDPVGFGLVTRFKSGSHCCAIQLVPVHAVVLSLALFIAVL